MSIRAIFNADDYNLTPGVCRGILEAHRRGVVRSTSFMVNLPGAEEAARLLEAHPNLDVGLHVNLTFGKPVSDPVEVSSLVDDEGIFWRKPSMLMEFARMDQLQVEILAQFELARKMGLKLTHIDSHHHVHQFEPAIHQMLVEIAAENDMAVRSVDDDMRKYCREKGVLTNDSFHGQFYGDGVSAENLGRIFDSVEGGFAEVMCHPGENDEQLKLISSYNSKRPEEIKVLTGRATLYLMDEYSVKPAGWSDLLNFNAGFQINQNLETRR